MKVSENVKLVQQRMLHDQGYTHLRMVGDLGWCGIYRFVFTFGVCISLDRVGYAGRFCFDNLPCAALFLKEWDGKEFPIVGKDGCTAIKSIRKQQKITPPAWGDDKAY